MYIPKVLQIPSSIIKDNECPGVMPGLLSRTTNKRERAKNKKMHVVMLSKQCSSSVIEYRWRART